MPGAPSPIFIPIIIPSPPRDCITVEGKVYCRDESVTNKEIGEFVLIMLLIGLYIIGVMHFSLEKYDSGWMLVAGLGIPVFILGLVMYLT